MRRTKTKKILSVGLCFAIMLSICACGSEKNKSLPYNMQEKSVGFNDTFLFEYRTYGAGFDVEEKGEDGFYKKTTWSDPNAPATNCVVINDIETLNNAFETYRGNENIDFQTKMVVIYFYTSNR